jgi:hypothetical protein
MASSRKKGVYLISRRMAKERLVISKRAKTDNKG